MDVKIESFMGKTFSKVTASDDEIVFYENNGKIYRMFHMQDCCEDVAIEDICGDIDNLVGSPITFAQEVTNRDMSDDFPGTYTFYKLATTKGWVDIRWYGESNGHYSEEVSIEEEEEGSSIGYYMNDEMMEKVKELLTHFNYEDLCHISKYVEIMKIKEKDLCD